MDESELSEAVKRGYEIGTPLIREFIIDFLGSLVPGVVCLVALVPAVLVPAWVVLDDLSPRLHSDVSKLIATNVDLPVTILLIVIPLFLLFLAAAYVFGHLFYRQDPKKADEASFARVASTSGNRGMVRMMRGKNRTLETPVEFPYHFLKAYLADRGIDYLAELVPWGPADLGEDESEREDPQFSRRAKHFANALKLRIQIISLQAYNVIARNEAHVRLSSSMWYVARFLAKCASAGVGLCLVPVLLTWRLGSVSPVVVFPASVLIVSFAVRRAIERSLHYQREREILFILESAYWLWHTGASPKIFDGLTEETVALE